MPAYRLVSSESSSLSEERMDVEGDIDPELIVSVVLVFEIQLDTKTVTLCSRGLVTS